jgi:hypothetical protein
LSEAFQLASAGGCDTGLQTRSRHACNFFIRVFTIGAGSAAAFGSAFAQYHGSRLFTLRLLYIYSPAVPFLTSPGFGSFSRGLPSLRGLPGSNAHFVPPFGVFRLAVPLFILNPPESFVRADTQ